MLRRLDQDDPPSGPGACSRGPSLDPPPARLVETNGYWCGDEPIQAGRVYEVDERQGIGFGIHRRFGQSGLEANAGERRVEKGIVQGRPAVFIYPLTEGGAGNSWIAFKDGDDLIELIAADLRFDDLRRIAESLPL